MSASTFNFPVFPADAQDVSAQLSAFSGPPLDFGMWPSSWSPRAYAISVPAVTVIGGAFTARENLLFERHWWDQVHIIPSTFSLGFVLSQVTRSFEVYNNFRRAQTLTNISFSYGGSGMFIETGPVAPAHYPTTAAKNYTLRVTTDVSPVIKDSIVFTFGTYERSLPVDGTRLIAFSISPNWEDGISEGIGYLTDVMSAYDTTEQRVQLRARPRRTMQFRALAEEARDAALLHGILYNWQPRVYGVPIWQDIQKTTADVAAGDLVIQVDTTDRQYEAGGLAFIWRNPHEWEAFQIASLTASTITIASPAQAAWTRASGAWIMPMRAGRLGDSQTLSRLSVSVSEARVTFIIDGVLT